MMADTFIHRTQEFTPRGELVTAQIDTSLDTGERFTGPLVVGYYPDEHNPELWIEQEGQRVQFHAPALVPLIKQLRRAAKISKEGNHA